MLRPRYFSIANPCHSMEHNRCFRITADDIEDLRDRRVDESLIEAYTLWIEKASQLDPLVQSIEKAFADLTLGDGIGLLEGCGLDDYASSEKLAEMRSRDERTDWRRIDAEMLNRYYSSLSFMDLRGIVFHLPALLIAELNDQYDYGFIHRLLDGGLLPGWLELLSPAQRNAIADVLTLIREHPEYSDRREDIDRTETTLRGRQS